MDTASSDMDDVVAEALDNARKDFKDEAEENVVECVLEFPSTVNLSLEVLDVNKGKKNGNHITTTKERSHFLSPIRMNVDCA